MPETAINLCQDRGLLLLSFAINSEHPCYAAHFPGDPIVPGALLLDWILRLLKQHYPHIRISGLHTVKFLCMVKPGDDCQLTALENTTDSQVKIKLSCNGKLVLNGILDTQGLEQP